MAMVSHPVRTQMRRVASEGGWSPAAASGAFDYYHETHYTRHPLIASPLQLSMVAARKGPGGGPGGRIAVEPAGEVSGLAIPESSCNQ
jgi:hypothetical protein